MRRLQFIKRAQELGFTLDESEELLSLDSGGPDSCDVARVLAEHRRADLEARIRDLQRMHDSLADEHWPVCADNERAASPKCSSIWTRGSTLP